MTNTTQKPVFINHLNLIRENIKKQDNLKQAQNQTLKQNHKAVVV
jgi:hypothetical protein